MAKGPKSRTDDSYGAGVPKGRGMFGVNDTSPVPGPGQSPRKGGASKGASPKQGGSTKGASPKGGGDIVGPTQKLQGGDCYLSGKTPKGD